ncbi:MAG: DUF7521 family protein [archaeon]
MEYRAAVLAGSILVVLVLGGYVTYVAVKAARRTETAAMWALGAGFALITGGTIVAELCLLDVVPPLDVVEMGVGVLVTLGFGALTYSMYVD